MLIFVGNPGIDSIRYLPIFIDRTVFSNLRDSRRSSFCVQILFMADKDEDGEATFQEPFGWMHSV